MKNITLIILSVFIFFTGNIFARQIDTLDTFGEEELVVDTLLTKDTLSLLEVQPLINENLNEILTEKMDSLVESWYVKNAFKLDSSEITLIETYPKDIPDSVYIERLQNIEQVINLSFNNVVKNYIKVYTEKKRDLAEVIIGLSYYYFPMIEETLDKYNMPLELKYLAIIESALNPGARSRVGANGMWQFMYGTAKNMDLDITSFVDERNDPDKSTDAAARYLQKLYNMYGDWYLAIAAYNCGPGNVNRAIRRSGGKRNYWEIYYRLPRETRGYVPAFIAASYFMNYFREHNLIPNFPEISVNTDTVMVSNYLHFDQLSATLDISKEELQSLNPMYRREIIPAKEDKPYPVVLPEDKIMDFIDNDSVVFAFEREKYFPNNILEQPTESTGNYTPVDVKGKAKVIYTVKAGDNVGYISSWFHVRASDLRYWNNIRRNLIRVGQKLVIYVPENQKSKYEKLNSMTLAQKQATLGKTAGNSSNVSSTQTNSQDSNYIYYTVKKGDSIWDIAQKYAGISSDEIIRLNNISNERSLYVGQKLKIKRKI